VQKCAAEALGDIGDSDALPQLERMKNDQDSVIRGAAYFAIEKIKNRW
jgi:HEAT repeat protein